MNGMYLRAMSLDEFHALCLPYYKNAIIRDCDLKEVSKILQQRISILSEIPEMVDFIDTLADYDVTMFYHPKMKTNREISILALEESLKVYETVENWDSVDEIHQKLSETPARLGVKNGQFYWPIRTAVTGKQFTPGGALEIPYILGKEETLRRTHIGLEKLRKI
jgi:nondiscriminating glutamyl-tRNA synthetase